MTYPHQQEEVANGNTAKRDRVAGENPGVPLMRITLAFRMNNKEWVNHGFAK
ncbi:hypothetical protein ACFO25_09085 [Paenactinomyces guangxiensis]|uniref:Uncharacterized protein n=1 Tax=Paenactinomyces guangxiensis TaxID=1490290 RepID=A0A7W2A753_9BACL|nr:hypothetical protein [Paenactinomyces guangxiensis]MBA4492799.1 hypothetical protein [Paenactinomyces guangxiensis]MBH8590352.1 hypothetical protein [Paenactinomyces guangxiensis]